MLGTRFLASLTIAMIVSCVATAEAQVTDTQVTQAIDRAVSYLKSLQDVRGGWREIAITSRHGGVSSLATLALLNCGVPLDDPAMERALAYVRRLRPNTTYGISLQTMVLCAATPESDRIQIRQNVLWLQRNQTRSGPGKGGWFYGEKPTSADNSNAQFALLALYEAERVGVITDERVWRLALSYWTRQQHKDGAWGYKPGEIGRIKLGSMTCAGIASLMITTNQIGEGDASVREGEVQCCGKQADNDGIERGLKWLGKNFSVKHNPSPDPEGNPWWLYYLYAMERVGRMSGQRFIGRHDWYREGAEYLVKTQIAGSWKTKDTEGHPPIATSLGLLFLSKGKRPILIGKLQRSADDWNLHRHDLVSLTRHVEQRWRRDLAWQTINVAAASAEDLLQTPVLFISGRESLQLTSEQKTTLKEYISQGGFIFAEASCGGTGFDRDFRNLVSELFPDSELRILPVDHPIWYAEQKVNPEFLTDRPLYGLQACCRTSIVYCEGDLSCYWELAGNRKRKKFPRLVRNEIDACLAIGANVLTYATNRELRNKLDVPQILASGGDRIDLARGTLHVAKLFHNGGSDDAPAALSNLLQVTQTELQLRIGAEKRVLPITSDSLLDYPIAFMHGRRNFRLSPQERKALARYLQNGGFLLVDSICASQPFADSFRREMKQVLPDHQLVRLRPDHPLFSDEFQGSDITTVRVRDPQRRVNRNQPLSARVETLSPELEGITIDERLSVVFSPLDLSCALENQASLECKGYVTEDAAKIGMNIILYAMQQ